jgi:hypothetical protein
MKIIALDLATTTGFCVGDTRAIGAVPEWGWFTLAGVRDLNASFVGLYNELENLIERVKPNFVVYETPLSRANRLTARGTPDLLMGLAAVCRLVCQHNAVDVYEQPFSEVRKLVLGKGTFQKPLRGKGKIRNGKLVGDTKEEVRAWLLEYGWGAITQGDAADAAVLFRYAQMISGTKIRTA